MSYSRWINSYWYTFWCTQDKKTENRDTCVFKICGMIGFTAKQLREDLDCCIDIVKKKDPNTNEDHINELKQYIKRFLKEVDVEYPYPETLQL